MHPPSFFKTADVGVIHGRFQVLHKDHLAYILAGKERCRTLVVGITNPDPVHTRKEAASPERDDPMANPLTYFERLLLIRAALREEGVPLSQFVVVPFPVNFPDLYSCYVPMEALFFLTIYDEWGKQKHDYFQSLGLNIHILREVPPQQKGISGTDIRQQMIRAEPWEHLVPPAVASLLKEWDIAGRLRGMAGKDSEKNK